jgi:signal peptidase II
VPGTGRKNGRKMRKKWIIFTVFFPLVIVIDQLSKYLVSVNMYQGQHIRIIGPYLRIVYIRNPHAAFGIPLGSPLLMLILTSIASVLLVIYFTLVSNKTAFFYFAITLIIGGAIGNLIDRLRIKEVIDFIEVGVEKFKWPVFNVADSCVTVGIILLLWIWFFRTKKEGEENSTRKTKTLDKSIKIVNNS